MWRTFENLHNKTYASKLSWLFIFDTIKTFLNLFVIIYGYCCSKSRKAPGFLFGILKRILKFMLLKKQNKKTTKNKETHGRPNLRSMNRSICLYKVWLTYATQFQKDSKTSSLLSWSISPQRSCFNVELKENDINNMYWLVLICINNTKKQIEHFGYTLNAYCYVTKYDNATDYFVKALPLNNQNYFREKNPLVFKEKG